MHPSVPRANPSVTGHTLRILEGHFGPVMCARALSESKALSHSGDNTLRLWNLTTGAEEARFTLDEPISALAISAPSQRIVVGEMKGRIFTFRLGGGIRLECLEK
jgi:WD40 repeat protein